jgi:hypothetical protein
VHIKYWALYQISGVIQYWALHQATMVTLCAWHTLLITTEKHSVVGPEDVCGPNFKGPQVLH